MVNKKYKNGGSENRRIIRTYTSFEKKKNDGSLYIVTYLTAGDVYARIANLTSILEFKKFP